MRKMKECTKKPLSERQAKDMLLYCQARGKKQKYPKGYWFCYKCNAFHVTSKNTKRTVLNYEDIPYDEIFSKDTYIVFERVENSTIWQTEYFSKRIDEQYFLLIIQCFEFHNGILRKRKRGHVLFFEYGAKIIQDKKLEFCITKKLCENIGYNLAYIDPELFSKKIILYYRNNF